MEATGHAWLRDWWRLLQANAASHGAERLSTLPVLFLSGTAADAAAFRADLPAAVRQSLYDSFGGAPPPPGVPSIVHAGPNDLSQMDAMTATRSSAMRVAVIPPDAEVAAAVLVRELTANTPSQELMPLLIRGWPAGTGASLAAELEMERRQYVPPAFANWADVRPQPTALVLAGRATEHLLSELPAVRRGLKAWRTRMPVLLNSVSSWAWLTDGLGLLIVDTSFDETLNPALAGTGVQSVLRTIVMDVTRRYDVVIVLDDASAARLASLNFPRDGGWWLAILPDDCQPPAPVAVAASGWNRPQGGNTLGSRLTPGFKLPPAAASLLHPAKPMHHEDRVAVEQELMNWRRRAAVGLTRSY